MSHVAHSLDWPGIWHRCGLAHGACKAGASTQGQAVGLVQVYPDSVGYTCTEPIRWILKKLQQVLFSCWCYSARPIHDLFFAYFSAFRKTSLDSRAVLATCSDMFYTSIPKCLPLTRTEGNRSPSTFSAQVSWVSMCCQTAKKRKKAYVKGTPGAQGIISCSFLDHCLLT